MDPGFGVSEKNPDPPDPKFLYVALSSLANKRDL